MTAHVKEKAKPLCALAIVIFLGLASRKYPFLFPEFLGKYPGDALWAIAVYFALKVIFSNKPSGLLLSSALGISYFIELTQLYQANWINLIRENPIGHLFLGTTFSYIDLAAYTVGIAIMYAIEFGIKLASRKH